MSRFIPLIQNKIALAIIGTILFGGVAALIASASFTGTTNQPSPNQSQTYANIAPHGNNTPTPSASTASPTTGSGQATTLDGTVTRVNTGTSRFTVRVHGGVTKTVVVQSQTTFQGACTSLSGLSPGWRVAVQGTYQADGSFVAARVTSSLDR